MFKLCLIHVWMNSNHFRFIFSTLIFQHVHVQTQKCRWDIRFRPPRKTAWRLKLSSYNSWLRPFIAFQNCRHVVDEKMRNMSKTTRLLQTWFCTLSPLKMQLLKNSKANTKESASHHVWKLQPKVFPALIWEDPPFGSDPLSDSGGECFAPWWNPLFFIMSTNLSSSQAPCSA